MADLDLHGYTWDDAREELVRFYNEAVARHDALPFQVIHGWGASGKGSVLRSAVRTFLTLNRVHFIPGEQYDGNPGHTLVTPGHPLPGLTDRLQREILAYCRSPRTKSEITGKFRRHTEPAVVAAISALKSRKLLTEISHNGRKKWQAV